MKADAKLQAVPKEADQELDFGQFDETQPLVPEGVYEVAFVRAGKQWFGYGRRNVLLVFRIFTPGQYEGVELYMPVRISPRPGMKSLAMSSKLVRAVTVALGHAPTRRDRPTTAVFKGKYFKADVKTVKRDSERKPLPEASWYSVIDRLLERTAGA